MSDHSASYAGVLSYRLSVFLIWRFSSDNASRIAPGFEGQARKMQFSPITRFCLVLIVSMQVVSNACTTLSSYDRRVEAERMVAAVEEYRRVNGRLPDSVEQLGLKERIEGPAYYRKLSEKRYQVWFGTSLGESMVYDSVDKKWQPYFRE